MSEHYRADRSATPFSRTVNFGPRCPCGAQTEELLSGVLLCQVCDNTPDGRHGEEHQRERDDR